jgi:REP element-mobilizing transposase RayT
MDNHLHMIVHSPIISKTIQDFKKYTAKQIIEALQYDKRKWILPLLQQYKKQHKIHSIHQVWQEGSHPEKIVNEIMLNQKIDYIHKNPIKRGFVTEDCHWLYSSARNTQNLSAPIQVDTIDDFIGLDCE